MKAKAIISIACGSFLPNFKKTDVTFEGRGNEVIGQSVPVGMPSGQKAF